MKLFFLFLISLFCCSVMQGQDMVYKPKNPAFGGDTFNYQWMLSSAQAQDTFKDPATKIGSTTKDPLTDFENNLNRQILYQLSRQLVTKQFGTDGLDEGSYQVGSYQIEITEGAGGINVKILDSSTGSQTSVLVPNVQ